MSKLMADIDDLLHKIELSNTCLADLIHDGHKVDAPEIPHWEKKYEVLSRLATNLRDRRAELENLR